jgi:hypothetical protein
MDALAVIVDGDGQFLFGSVLPDYVLIQELLDFQGLGNLIGTAGSGLGLVVFEDRVANGNALVADVRAGIVAGGGDELTDYVLAFMAK